ncbi:hypothetical protein AWB67_06668 [Caballeronia terrestris]|uniref:Uncharacterized protein n=1 Tax=Caballeronia terrestris TaxID=1226301 RepID=A0A158KUI9_9BURK|nr:hypothetical protein AWB67_06668 [Caballeronia terrestris]
MVGEAEGHRQTDWTSSNDRNCMPLCLGAVVQLRHLGSVFFCSEGISFEFHRLLLNEFLKRSVDCGSWMTRFSSLGTSP